MKTIKIVFITVNDIIKKFLIENINTVFLFYRFSVVCLYKNGPQSVESEMSEPCIIEAELPYGFLRMFDSSKGIYYFNTARKEIHWKRPDLEPCFLEESVRAYFSTLELSTLREKYRVEMDQYGGLVSVLRFQNVLYQIGEYDVNISALENLFKNFTRNAHQTTSISLSRWKHFMDVMRYLKKRRMKKTNTMMRYLRSMLISSTTNSCDNSSNHSDMIDIPRKRRRRVFRPTTIGSW